MPRDLSDLNSNPHPNPHQLSMPRDLFSPATKEGTPPPPQRAHQTPEFANASPHVVTRASAPPGFFSPPTSRLGPLPPPTSAASALGLFLGGGSTPKAAAMPASPALRAQLSSLSETSVCSASGGSGSEVAPEEEPSPTEATPLSPLKPAARSAHR